MVIYFIFCCSVSDGLFKYQIWSRSYQRNWHGKGFFCCFFYPKITVVLSFTHTRVANVFFWTPFVSIELSRFYYSSSYCSLSSLHVSSVLDLSVIGCAVLADLIRICRTWEHTMCVWWQIKPCLSCRRLQQCWTHWRNMESNTRSMRMCE